MENPSEWARREYLSLWKQWGIDSPLSKAPAPVKSVLKTRPTVIAKAVVPSPNVPPILTPALEAIVSEIGDCRRCGLCAERTRIVFGSGNPKARLLFVGEGPGADEDREGLPFVGKAGQLLTKIIEALGYQREDVYIANVVKCRPPQNRAPEPSEIASCLPFLKSQIEVVGPQVVVALGLHAAVTLTGQDSAISNLRGRFHQLHWNPSIPVMPTYHPAYLLRNPAAKKMVWDDLKLVKGKLESTS